MTRAALKLGEEQLRLAMLASDVEMLDALIDDALIFSSPTGALVRKEDDLENHRRGRLKLTKLALRDLVVELFGEELGIVTVLADLEGTFDGTPIGGTFRYVRTWRREHDGAWRVVAGSVTAATSS